MIKLLLLLLLYSILKNLRTYKELKNNLHKELKGRESKTWKLMIDNLVYKGNYLFMEINMTAEIYQNSYTFFCLNYTLFWWKK